MYDPQGVADGSTGDLLHSAFAFSLGQIGDANCRVSDTMFIPFTVARSDVYDIKVSGNVRLEIYNIGANFKLGSHWGDFSISIRDASIRDLTTGSIIYSGLNRNIYYSKTSLIDALEPALWDSIDLLLEQYFPLVAAQDFIKAGQKVQAIYDKLAFTTGIEKIVATNYTTTCSVQLQPGRTYRIEPHIESTVTASSVDLYVGGHFSGVRGTLHISDFSVIPRTPSYELLVQSGDASTIDIIASPADSNGSSSVKTPQTLNYLSGTQVSLTAPPTVGAKTFTGWMGVENQTGNIGFVTMNADHVATALYADSPATIVITSPTSGAIWTTGSGKVALNGITTGNVNSIAWRNITTGSSESATGISFWKTGLISLNEGANNIVVTAVDFAGRTVADSISVIYNNTAVTAFLPLTKEASIFSGSPRKNVEASYVGFHSDPLYQKERTLLGFSLNSLPPGLTFLSASLKLYNSVTTPVGAPPINVTVYRIRADWGERSVNWDVQPSFSTISSSTASVGTVKDKFYTWDLSGIVSSWLAGTPNYGLFLISDQEGANITNDREFGAGTRNDPQLLVVYAPEANPPTISINNPTSAGSIYFTNATASIPIGGIASDAFTVTSVSWNNATTGQNGNANGTTSWTADIPLGNGWNTVIVTATDASGNVGSDAKQIFYAIPDKEAPTTPMSTFATARSSTEVALSWGLSTDTGGSGFKEYRIYRNDIFRTTSKFLAFTDSGLSPSTSYCYTVSATDNAGNESPLSVAACISTTPPEAPSMSFVQSALGSHSVLRVSSSTGYTYMVESSVDLEIWTPFTSLTSTNVTSDIVLERDPSLPRTFYRAKFVP